MTPGWHACHFPFREHLLQLPHNSAAFTLLQDKGVHPAYKDLAQQLPGGCRSSQAVRLQACLSQLAHWCPLFGELQLVQTAALLVNSNEGVTGCIQCSTMCHIGLGDLHDMPLFCTANAAGPLVHSRLLLVRLLCCIAKHCCGCVGSGLVWVCAGEVGFLPRFVFPFVQQYGAKAESAFELVVTLLLNWCNGWFQLFPNPPMALLRQVLVRLRDER